MIGYSHPQTTGTTVHSLRETIVAALRDEADHFAGTGNPQHDLASQVLERLANKVEASLLDEDESSVVVPPGGTLVLRIGTHMTADDYTEYQTAMNHAMAQYARRPDLQVLVVVADQLGVCSEDHRPSVDEHPVR